jgi:ABC-type molybdate transport system permease subunit
MDWQAIWLSVRLAAATTAILLALAMPVAYWLTWSPRRWKYRASTRPTCPLPPGITMRSGCTGLKRLVVIMGSLVDRLHLVVATAVRFNAVASSA